MGQKVLQPVHLVGGKQLGVNLIQPQLAGHCLAHRMTVAGEHDGADTPGLQRGDGGGGGLLDLVGDDGAAQVFALPGHIDQGACIGAGQAGDALPCHELVVARQHLGATHLRGYPVSGNFPDALRPARVNVTPPGPAEGLGNGMAGVALG